MRNCSERRRPFRLNCVDAVDEVFLLEERETGWMMMRVVVVVAGETKLEPKLMLKLKLMRRVLGVEVLDKDDRLLVLDQMWSEKKVTRVKAAKAAKWQIWDVV